MAKKKVCRNKDGDEFVGECKCGGSVWGTWGHGYMSTYCDKCTPFAVIDVDGFDFRIYTDAKKPTRTK